MLDHIVSSHGTIAAELTLEWELSRMLHSMPLGLHFSIGDVAADVTGKGDTCMLSQVSLKEIMVLGDKATFGAEQLLAACL